MTKVYVGVGSNINPKKNLRLAIQKLQERFGALNISPVYKSNSVGFVGEDFLNLVIGFVTYESIENVLKIIETLHQISGRNSYLEHLILIYYYMEI
jgi:2-amino-4-hydroxy-6-hydroxymethyldihydropteridine diphosphokinase